MFKLLFVVFLIYLSFRVFSPKQLKSDQQDILDETDDGFTEYEEIDE